MRNLIPARRGGAKIGTTGRGIGPAYEDKIVRRAIRVCDLADPASSSRRMRRCCCIITPCCAAWGSEVDGAELAKQLVPVGPKRSALV